MFEYEYIDAGFEGQKPSRAASEPYNSECANTDVLEPLRNSTGSVPLYRQPLLASVCIEIISLFAVCISASCSSAVCRLQKISKMYEIN